jgi:Tol biopolymer transport system component
MAGRWWLTAAAGVVAALTAGGAAAAPAPGFTELVSLSGGGVQGNQDSEAADVSADGRFVAFVSLADNLVPGDTNETCDIFVRDRRSDRTERVSVSSDGAQGDGCSGFLAGMGGPSISSDGRFVAFDSEATNLVPLDLNGTQDVFVRDRLLGTTERVSVSSAGAEASGFEGAISGDGRRVAFLSFSENIVEPDTNFASDVFVHDRRTGRTVRVSDGFDGSQANNISFDPGLDEDGSLVVFDSFATNLVRGDDDSLDVFLHNLRTGRTQGISVRRESSGVLVRGAGGDLSADGRFVAFSTQDPGFVRDRNEFVQDVLVYDRFRDRYELASVSDRGGAGDDNSIDPSLSADGRFVAFTSFATNLVREDGNFRPDVFVRDRLRDTTRRVSVGGRGQESDLDSGSPAVSSDGDAIAFTSRASTFVDETTEFFANDIWVRDARGRPRD